MKLNMTLSLMTVFVASLLFTALAHATTLKTEASDKLFETAQLFKSVTLQNDDKSEVALKPVSHGLREKAVFGPIAVNVYVLQFFAATPEKLVKTNDGILASLKDSGPVQLNITFLRGLAGEKISSSFKDGLAINKIDTEKLSPELTQALKVASDIAEFKKGDNFSITAVWANDKSTVYISDAQLKITAITGSKDFAQQLLSIWFGKTTDGKLENLKQSLIK